MGKVVKFCAACDEGFAERFGFCPNCGGALTAYEMNPILRNAEPVNPPTAIPQTIESAAPINELSSAPPVAKGNMFIADSYSEPILTSAPPVVEAKTEEPPPTVAFAPAEEFEDEILDIKDEPIAVAPPVVEVPPINVVPPPAPTMSSRFRSSFLPDETIVSDNLPAPRRYNPKAAAPAAARVTARLPKRNNGSPVKYDDGLYHVNFVEDKNASWRNLLLFGALFLVTAVTFASVGYSLFAKNAYIGSLSDPNSLLAFVEDVEPAAELEEEVPKKNPDKGGGGGGGGRDEETPTSKGRLAPQMRATPMLTPTKTIEQKDFELKYQATTVGDKMVQPTNEKYGDPASKFDLSSDGMGSGGGQGSGRGTGQGSGRGTGQGSGIGSGSGSGNGNGNGDGTGDGDGGDGGPPPPVKKSPPEPLKIISRPKPPYTDSARQNQVQGVVRLKVMFLASGQIGSVTPISGLPYGLTEQAIAAAKQIRFEPAKVNGSPQTVSRTIEYSFSIY